MLELKNLVKRFQALVATNDVSMTFEPGKIYGIIGPNGAGKSTLINLMSGSFPPTSGEIVLNGTSVQSLPKHKISVAGIARTYQNVRLFDHLTAIENLEVCFYPADRGSVWKEVFVPGFGKKRNSERRDLCYAILELCGIEQYADTQANLLPYGRQRILEIARALVRDPSVLLLDEPAAGLNHLETADLTARLRSFLKPHRSIIVVEHDMDLVMSLCDWIYVLNFGSLLFAGTPAQVQASEIVQEAYLGTTDELDEIRALAQDRKANLGLRANADPQQH
ncbi:ABC transporter ATP-binding protein [Brucella gallinifaecis]|uniref:ABC transporter ATP-binding protein n=1 Tax=Brucella gallinifaecis TaxID=215590 RepID=A0A502BLY4_9HYPH|nr:ABC transporter ATP-binding protein [Brucella gallinifaecis]TPF74699.1 ABC transporter ATP-binding protein [Brucella gallinifaecis]